MSVRRSAKPPPRAVASKPSDTAARILNVAEELFAEHGFDAVSLQTIATRAGISKANIFHHYSSKDALYLAAIKHACRHAATLIDEFDGAGSFADRLGRFLNAHLQQLLAQQQVSRLIARELLKGNPRRVQDLARQAFGESFARLVDILRRAQTHGDLRADVEPAALAVFLIGADVFFVQNQHVLRHFPAVNFADNAEHYSQQLVALILRGVMPLPQGV